MALTVRTEVGGAGNSYNSLAELNAELVDNRHDTAWQAATDGAKETAAISATDYMDGRYRIKTDCDMDKVKLVHVLLSQQALGGSLYVLPGTTANGTVTLDRRKVGPLEKETRYAGGTNGSFRSFPWIDALIAGCLVRATAMTAVTCDSSCRCC